MSGFLLKVFRGDMESPLRGGGIHGSESNFICLGLRSTIFKERNSLYPRTPPFTIYQQYPFLCRERIQEMPLFMHRREKRPYSSIVEKP